MFSHIFVNRFKCLVRDKEMMFWTLLFPILLATLFNMAFSNLAKNEEFEIVNIAVVDSTEYQNDVNFKNVISSLSTDNKDNSEDMFNVKITTKENAEELLKNNKISGYIIYDSGMKLVVKESGINQTIIKSFLDDYAVTSSAVYTIINNNPNAMHEGLQADLENRQEYLKDVPAGKSNPDTTLNYFYTLIAMCCLYGGFMGMKEVTAIQANLSAQGARVNLVPTHKLKIFGYSICAATAIQYISILIVLAYLSLVLKIDFGNQIGFILLTCLVGCFTGVSFGTFIGAAVKKGEGVKTAVLISSSMTLSFLSGMMMVDMKYIIASKAPILAYLNPANLITDAFYSLYFFDSYNRYFLNIGLLLGFIAIFYSLTYFILRRQKYASI